MKPEARPSEGLFGKAIVTAACVATSLIFVAWAKMETVQITYAINDLIREEDGLAAEQRRLRAELAELRAPAQLEALAPTLGLVRAKPEQVVVITEDPEALAASLATTADGAIPSPEPRGGVGQ